MKRLTNLLNLKKIAKKMYSPLALILIGAMTFSCSLKDIPKRPDHPKPGTTQTTPYDPTGTSDINNQDSENEESRQDPGTSDYQDTEDYTLKMDDFVPPTEIDECEHYSTKVIVTGKDSDSVDYTLPQKPEGMTIDSTGLIGWNTPCGISSNMNFSTTANASNENASVSKTWNILVKKIQEVPPENQAPTITITPDFETGYSVMCGGEEKPGQVKYNISTEDPDGYVGTVDGTINGSYTFTGSNPTGLNPFEFSMCVPIISGTNDFYATATDDKGKQITGNYKFESPTESEWRAETKANLDARLANGEFQSYDWDAPVNMPYCSLSGSKIFFIDVRIKRNDGTSLYVNRMNLNDLTDEMENKLILDCNGRSNLYEAGVPFNKSKLNDFLDANLN